MIRKAQIKDVKKMQKLINHFAEKDLMLPRSINELYENLRDFWVCENNNNIVATVGLHIAWENLAEIKSLAVNTNYQKKGIGVELVKNCIKEAKQLGAKKVFVLTYNTKFFKKFKFRTVSHSKLPHKIWAECIQCPKFPNCKEIAMIKSI